MDFIGKEVIHNEFGKGKIVSAEENPSYTYLLIKFATKEIKMVYPQSFGKVVKFVDDDINKSADEAIKLEKTVKQLETEAKYENRKKQHAEDLIKGKTTKKYKRAKKPNVAFKCNYCDGGKSDTCFGYKNVCSKEMINYNINIKKRTWCSDKDCLCKQYLDGALEYSDLQEAINNKEFVCYESGMLINWKASAGVNQIGERRGETRKFADVRKDSLAILTTRLPDSDESERLIFAVFLVDDAYEGDEKDEGFVSADSQYKIELTPEEAKKMPFWKYHANDKNEEASKWGQGLYRKVTDIEAAQILKDIAKIKEGTADEILAKEFFEGFTKAVNIDVDILEEPSGALTK